LPAVSTSRQSLVVRAIVALVLVAVLGAGHSYLPPSTTAAPRAHVAPLRVADLEGSVAGLFLKLVNDRLRGRIEPRAVTFRAPAGLILEETVLTDPRGAPVARVKHIELQLDVRALLLGELAISRIDAIEPRLLLEIEDGKLNLLEALSPRKKPDTRKKAEGAFRIEDIRLSKGGFRLRDGQTITITADDISARASLDVDLDHELVHVDVRDVGITTGNLRLPEMDIPLHGVSARRVNVLTDVVDLSDVTGQALGSPDGTGQRARVTLSGSIQTRGDGALQLKGKVDADADAWPQRLATLGFPTPTIQADVGVRGPFRAPTVDVDGHFGSFPLYGYRLEGGEAHVVVDRERVSIRDTTRVATSEKGVVTVGGEVRFGSTVAATMIDVRARIADVSLASMLAPAKLDATMKGNLSGSARISGPVGGDRTELSVTGTASGRSLSLDDVTMPVETDADFRFVVRRERVELSRVRLRDPLGDFVGTLNGDIDLDGDTVDLALVVDGSDVRDFVASIPSDLVTQKLSFRGRIRGPFKRVVVDGDASVGAGSAWGVRFEDVACHVTVAADVVQVVDVRGQVLGGRLTQRAPLELSLGKRANVFRSGRFFVQNAALAALRTPANEPLPLSGRLDLEAKLLGTIEKPKVLVRAASEGLVVAGEVLGTARASLWVTKTAVDIATVELDGPSLRASGHGLRLETGSLNLAGVVDVAVVDFARFAIGAKAHLRGRGAGIVRIDGDVRQPSLRAELFVRGLALSDFGLGDGPVSIGLAPDHASTLPKGASSTEDTTQHDDASRARPPLVVSVSAATRWDLGRYDVRAAWALSRETLVAEMRASDVDLSVLAPLLGSSAPPLSGIAHAQASLSGRLDDLTGRIRVRIPDVVVSRLVAGENTPELRAQGPAYVDAHLEHGALQATLCAFPDKSSRAKDDENSCNEPHRIWARAVGTIAPEAARYSLAVAGGVDEAHWEDLVPALASREIGLSSWMKVSARIDKETQGPAQVVLDSDVRDLIVRVPGAPPLRLQQRTSLHFADGRFRLEDKAARFITARQTLDVVIAAGSSVGADDIDLNVQGDVALSMFKLMSNEVANAAGTARTQITMRGRFSEGILLQGDLTPEPGARLTVRSLGQPLTFESGTLRFTPDTAQPELLRIDVFSSCDERKDGCPLRAQLGDGRVQLKGSMWARTSKTVEQTWIEQFDLTLSGSSLQWRDDVGRLEASCDLTLRGDASGPVLAGRVDVTEGLLHRDFELRNFVLSSSPKAPREPLWRRLTPYGLGALAFDVEASLQNVRTKARINAFSVDASLRGELRLGRFISLPSLDGTVEVEEGRVEFPRARFDIMEMQIQFPTATDGRLQPLVHLSARADIPPGAAGNDVEVPVDLIIDGTFDAMQLGLSAVDENRQWSRTELMAYILFGTVPSDASGTLAGTGVAVAQRAALRELALPVSMTIEQFVGNVGLDFNIDVVSGWELELGRRLVLEGQGLLSQQLGATDSTTTASTTGTTGTDALRVRLLLYDHLPLGRALSAEGRVGTTSDLRLAWRLIEE
jgi:hypothetical protein